jgi:hypothetical protein
MKAWNLLQVIRYLTVLLAGILAGSRSVEGIRAWREWRRWMVQDPSGADAYKSFFLISAGTAVLCLCLAGLVWHLLRPKKQL